MMVQSASVDPNLDDSAANSQQVASVPLRNNDAALFVGGLSFSATEDDLKQAFSSVGDILSVRIVQDRDTGKPRGFAFVNFESAENVDAAIQQCQGMELCGRNVRLDRSAAGAGGRVFGKGKGFMNMVPAYPPPGSEYGMYGGGYHRPHVVSDHYQMMTPHEYAPMPAYAHPGYPYAGMQHWQHQQHLHFATSVSGGPPQAPPAPPAPPAGSATGSS